MVIPLAELVGKSTVVIESELLLTEGDVSVSGSGALRGGKKTGALVKICLRQRQPAVGTDLREEKLNLLVFEDSHHTLDKIICGGVGTSATTTTGSRTSRSEVNASSSSSRSNVNVSVNNKRKTSKESLANPLEEDEDLFR